MSKSSDKILKSASKSKLKSTSNLGNLVSKISEDGKNSSGNYYNDKDLNGIFPLFLTSASQAIAKVIIDVDVTTELMYKMVPKQDLIQDMQNRLAISDFTPAKPRILAYPGNELMLHYDPEYKYSQNFFLVVEESTAELILKV